MTRWQRVDQAAVLAEDAEVSLARAEALRRLPLLLVLQRSWRRDVSAAALP